MEPEWLKVLLLWAACAAVAAILRRPPLWRALYRVALRLQDQLVGPRVVSPVRPLEAIAHDARRLGHRFRELPHGVSFVKFEGTRRAYDQVLAEGCLALGIDHLLGVLRPGEELDAERRRVELRLYSAGLRLDDAA